MDHGVSRRGVLASISILSLPSVARTSAKREQSGAQTDDDTPRTFEPSTDAFGFRNWAGATSQQTGTGLDLDEVPEETIRDALVDRWDEPLRQTVGLSVEALSEGLLTVISRQIHTTVNQLSGTNGHCYGMVFSAQRYFERPETIPLDRMRASDLEHPAEPVDDPEYNPVLDEIEHFHRTQFLDFYSWLGRRATVRPSWINYENQLRDVRAVLEGFGTAGITLVDQTTRNQHQVLVYDVRDRSDAVDLLVYDPNREAVRYATQEPLSITVDTTGEATMEPYGRYDDFVYNRFDRIVRARAEAELEPLERFEVTAEQVREAVFKPILVLVTSPAVSLSVVGPNGTRLERDRSPYMDTSRSNYDDMRYRYGTAPGEYHIGVFGEDDTEYTLRAHAADPDGDRLARTVEGQIQAGETHRYLATIPDGGGEGTIERVDDGGISPWIAGAAGAGVGAIGAGAYLQYRGGKAEKSSDSD